MLSQRSDITFYQLLLAKNLKNSSLLLSFDKNGCQSEDVFALTFLQLYSTQLTGVNLRHIQHSTRFIYFYIAFTYNTFNQAPHLVDFLCNQ